MEAVFPTLEERLEEITREEEINVPLFTTEELQEAGKRPKYSNTPESDHITDKVLKIVIEV